MSSRHRRNSRKTASKHRTISDTNSMLFTSSQIEKKTKNTWKADQRTSPNSILILDSDDESPNEMNSSTSKCDKRRVESNFSTSQRTNPKRRKEIVQGDDKNDDDDRENFNEISFERSNRDESEIDRCPICLDDCTEPKRLDKCSHTFCRACIDHYFERVKPQCPCCFTIYGEIRGNQPDNGTMSINTDKHRLPGFEHDSRGTIRIIYHFPHGIQDERHPNPGLSYRGTTRYAYLPDNREGRHVLKLLKKAFELRQIFTVGQSRTTGYDNVVTWNDIHHKTNILGGVENFGYPDSTYLSRVKQELAAKGIQ